MTPPVGNIVVADMLLLLFVVDLHYFMSNSECGAATKEEVVMQKLPKEEK